MSGDFKEIFKKKSFYGAVFAVICAAGVISVVQNNDKGGDDVKQIKLAQESSKEPRPTKETVSTYKPQQNDVNQYTENDVVPKVASGEKTNSKDEVTDGDKQETKNDVDDKNASVKTSAQVKHDASEYSFDEEKGIVWPVEGELIMSYSMDAPVFYATTQSFKTSDGLIIAADKGTGVKCGADGVVSKVYEDDEYGNMVEVALGNDYTITYGQLEDITVKEGEALNQSQIIGRVGEATDYFAKEGNNVYMRVEEKGEAIDPTFLMK